MKSGQFHLARRNCKINVCWMYIASYEEEYHELHSSCLWVDCFGIVDHHLLSGYVSTIYLNGLDKCDALLISVNG